jgi:hypothetical protein
VAERVRIRLDGPLRRSRLSVVFRLPLALPFAVLVAAWVPLAAAAVVAAWVAALAVGHAPAALHRFLLAFVGATLRLGAWLSLVTDRYPRVRDAHGASLVAPLEAQPRLVTLFRPLLAVPGVVLSSVLGVVLLGVAVGAWFTAVALGRTTEGLRELGAFCLRYVVETLAFLLLVTPHAPRLEPPPPAAEGGAARTV